MDLGEGRQVSDVAENIVLQMEGVVQVRGRKGVCLVSKTDLDVGGTHLDRVGFRVSDAGLARHSFYLFHWFKF